MKKFLTMLSVVMIFVASHTDAFSQKKIAYTHNDSKAGTASFYNNKFNGRKTATGETFFNTGYTAASNHFKLGTYVKVTNVKNGRFVYVKINDRMGHPSRVIDLTHQAAKDLKFVNSGLTQVKVELVHPEEGKKRILAQKEGTSPEAPTGNSL